MAPIENTKLTIAIPTYNRNETLKKNIEFLIPQIIDELVIIIYDNFSDIKVSETLREELKRHSQLQIRRNKTNIGLSGNIIRCIEECESEWLWILSDDDTACRDSINIIFDYIEKYPEILYINFKSNLTTSRKEDVYAVGENEFINKIDNIHNLFLISCGLYNVEKIRYNLRFAYLYSYSLVPHFVALITSLKNSGKIIFSKQSIITGQGSHTDPDRVWSYLPFCLGLPVLFELPLSLTNENESKFFNFVKKEIIRRPLTSFERVAQLYKKEELKILRYNFSQPYLRLKTKISLFWRLEYIVCMAVLTIPVLIPVFSFFLNRIRKIAKKPVTRIALDRFNRL